MTIQNGGAVYVGYGDNSPLDIGTGGGDSNLVFVVDPGSLLSCSGPLQLTRGGVQSDNVLSIFPGATVETPLLVVSNFNSIELAGGTLDTGGTIIDNGLPLLVGAGTDPATLHLDGGVHSFADGLIVTSNAFVTGCGTVNGPVTVDPGGTVLADCGGTLTFSGNVTNNGTIQTTNGSTITFLGTLVNNGVLSTNSAQPPPCATVITGSIMNLADSTTYTITDGTNFAEFNWSLAVPGASGYIYATFNTGVALATGVTNIDQITDAANFTFVSTAYDSIGPVNDAGANGGIGQFVVLRNENTHYYAVVRMDDVQDNGTLNATWWFQTSGSTNFSCTSPPDEGGVTNLNLRAVSGSLSLSFSTQLGRTYTIQTRTNLMSGTWITATNFVGDGALHEFLISVTNHSQGYYRVGVQ